MPRGFLHLPVTPAQVRGGYRLRAAALPCSGSVQLAARPHPIHTKETMDNIEQEIQAKGLTAPRVTPADIEANIASEWYFTGDEGIIGSRWVGSPIGESQDHFDDGFPLSMLHLTFCVLVLRNGFTVTGESACASPENFDAEVGRKIARQNAVQKIWPLMGYELRTKLAA